MKMNKKIMSFVFALSLGASVPVFGSGAKKMENIKASSLKSRVGWNALELGLTFGSAFAAGSVVMKRNNYSLYTMKNTVLAMIFGAFSGNLLSKFLRNYLFESNKESKGKYWVSTAPRDFVKSCVNGISVPMAGFALPGYLFANGIIDENRALICVSMGSGSFGGIKLGDYIGDRICDGV